MLGQANFFKIYTLEHRLGCRIFHCPWCLLCIPILFARILLGTSILRFVQKRRSHFKYPSSMKDTSSRFDARKRSLFGCLAFYVTS